MADTRSIDTNAVRLLFYSHLETVDLDLLRVADVLMNEELLDVRALVSLQLNHIPRFLILDHSSITLERLLNVFQDLFGIKIGGQTLHCCNTLPTVTLQARAQGGQLHDPTESLSASVVHAVGAVGAGGRERRRGSHGGRSRLGASRVQLGREGAQ